MKLILDDGTEIELQEIPSDVFIAHGDIGKPPLHEFFQSHETTHTHKFKGATKDITYKRDYSTFMYKSIKINFKFYAPKIKTQ